MFSGFSQYRPTSVPLLCYHNGSKVMISLLERDQHRNVSKHFQTSLCPCEEYVLELYQLGAFCHFQPLKFRMTNLVQEPPRVHFNLAFNKNNDEVDWWSAFYSTSFHPFALLSFRRTSGLIESTLHSRFLISPACFQHMFIFGTRQTYRVLEPAVNFFAVAEALRTLAEISAEHSHLCRLQIMTSCCLENVVEVTASL